MASFNWGNYKEVQPPSSPSPQGGGGFDWGKYQEVSSQPAVENSNNAQLRSLLMPSSSAKGILEDVGTGLARGTQSALKGLYDIYDLSPMGKAMSALSPSNDARIKQALSQQLPSLNENANPVDKAVENISSFAPYAMAPESAAPEAAGLVSNAAKGMLSGATYGAAQTETPKGALTGAAIGAVSPFAAKAVGGIGSAIAKPFASRVYNPLLSNLAPNIDAATNVSLDEGAKDIKRMFDAKKEVNNGQWDQAEYQANQLSGAPFDNSDYVGRLNTSLSNIRNKVGQDTNLSKAYGPAMDNLNNLIENAPNSYRDAMRTRESINAAKSNATLANNNISDPKLNRTTSTAQAALLDQVNSNIANNPEAQGFGNSWQQANQGFKELQNYKSLPVKGTGQLAPNSKMSMAMNSSPETSQFGGPDADLIKNFVPTGPSQGLSGMQHLGNLLDDEGQAKDLIKTSIFKPSLSDGFKPEEFLRKYKTLSPQQREYLFNPKEKSILDTALASKSLSNRSNAVTHWSLMHAPGMFIGGYAAEKRGLPWWSGAILGAAGQKMLSVPASGLGSSASVAKFLTNSAQKQLSTPAPLVNAGLQNIIGDSHG